MYVSVIKKHDVLGDHHEEEGLKLRRLRREGECACACAAVSSDVDKRQEGDSALYIEVFLEGGGHSSRAVISDYHTNIVLLEKDGEIIFQTKLERSSGSFWNTVSPSFSNRLMLA